MVNPRPLVIAVLGLGEAGSVIARDLLAAGAGVRGYDPAVAAGPGITDTGSEAEAARGADLVLSVNSAELAAAHAGTVERLLDGTRRHALRRTAEMEAAADMLSELGVPPLIAEASRAVHERLSAEQDPSGQRAERLR